MVVAVSPPLPKRGARGGVGGHRLLGVVNKPVWPPPGHGESLLVRRIEEQIQRNAGKEATEPSPFVRASEDEDEDSDEDEDESPPPADREPPRLHRKQRGKLPPAPLLPDVEDEDEDDDDDDDDSEDALSEFDFLGSGENGDGRRGAGEGGELESRRVRLQGMLAELRHGDGIPAAGGGAGPPHAPEGSCVPCDVFLLGGLGGAVSLGDLAELSVTNDSELGCHAPSERAAPRKTWNPKFTLRSHYDAVRALAFHPAEPALLTASEDGTLKLWNLQKAGSAKKNAALDVEPVYAFRGHRGPVLAVAVGRDAALCCSAGADGCVRRWRMPDLDADPYDGYDPGVQSGVLRGHGDAVWGLAFNPAGDRLLSCSADGTVRLWDPRHNADADTDADANANACLATYSAPADHGVPTSVTFCPASPAHAVLGFRSGAALLYDVEVTRPLLALDSRSAGRSGINHVVSHPSQPLSITAHDDRGIRLVDHRTGDVVHSMVAHLDAVTCLAIDPSGAFLMSGSHDCSVRVWQLWRRSCSCVQELSVHRRKHDEAVHAVAFHPTRALSASAGADALAKVFV